MLLASHIASYEYFREDDAFPRPHSKVAQTVCMYVRKRVWYLMEADETYNYRLMLHRQLWPVGCAIYAGLQLIYSSIIPPWLSELTALSRFPDSYTPA